jgi:serine phosphatase RsbU (regulator of sigma subunit)/CHASE3 domain sensor protein
METARQARLTLIAAVAALACFVAVFAVSGWFVRSVIADAFAKSEDVRLSRSLLALTVKLQLDEETGVRGYAATGERLFLDPYLEARAELPSTVDQLEARVDAIPLPAASALVRGAAASNREWLEAVAAPLTTKGAKDTVAIEKSGKTIIDRFRQQASSAERVLSVERGVVNDAMQSAIWRVGAFAFVASVAVVLIGTIFLSLQFRFLLRLERERLAAEQERSRLRELRAAYQAEKRIADTLQNALLQRPLPALDGLDLSATYVPAAEESKVGGDWYDVLEVPNDRVLFAIGDVAGHGIEAAVTMNRARESLLSSAIFARDPAAILGHANGELFREGATMVTAVAGFADYRTYELLVAVAGHPPPLLIEPGRPPRFLECGGLPLGVTPMSTYRTQRIQIAPGTVVVLYTDGAIEHTHDPLEGERILVEAAARAVSGPQSAARAIYDSIFAGRTANDDVAILTIGFPHAAQRPAPCAGTARAPAGARTGAVAS